MRINVLVMLILLIAVNSFNVLTR